VSTGRPIEHPTIAALAPSAFYEAGRRHMQEGRPLEAQLCCRQALAADPHHADSLHLMGLLALQARQYDHAIEWIARANQHDVNADYLLSLGTALEQQGLHGEAFKAFDQAVQLKPNDAESWASRGSALTRLEQRAEALACHQRVLEIEPDNADAAFRCGVLLLGLHCPAEALAYFDRCDRLRPNEGALLEQRAIALHTLKRFDEAVGDGYRAHQLDPASADICNNIGASLQFLCRDEEALSWFDKALALRPDFIMALINKASSLAQMRRIDETITTYRQVQTIDPGNAEAESYLSLIHRLIGNFEAGWPGQKARWNAEMRAESYPDFHQHLWLGKEDVNGKTILVFADEGLGDTIQFARYVPMLAARGAQVVLVVEEALRLLLSRLPGVIQCLPKPSNSLPPFDFHCPIGLLPMAFETRVDTIPAAESYLPPPSQARVLMWDRRLREHLGDDGKLRIGLAWSGNARHSNDHNRSIPLAALRSLLEVDARFVSLQKEPRPADRALLETSDIIDLTTDLTDFAETLALVSCLDLVITADTSTAHLAAAAGRPTWILLPYLPDYRWLLDRDDTPWYPTARLFRQSATRDWDEVAEKVRRALEEQIASRGQR
jgi:tetratricopeptide (TPR) repeat protein